MRAIPSQPSTRNVLIANSLMRSATARGHIGRNLKSCAIIVEVLRIVRIETVLVSRDYLSQLRRTDCHSLFKHGAFDFPHRGDTSLNQYLPVEAKANLQQASNSSAVRAFDTPTDEPMLAGLTKTSGEPTAPTASS